MCGVNGVWRSDTDIADQMPCDLSHILVIPYRGRPLGPPWIPAERPGAFELSDVLMVRIKGKNLISHTHKISSIGDQHRLSMSL